MPPEEQQVEQQQAEEEVSDRIAIQLGSRTEEASAGKDEEEEEGYALEGATLDDVFEVVVGLEGALAEPLRRIESELVARITGDKAKDKAFDALYEEMRQYKENFLHQAAKPLFLDLILLHDQVVRAAEQVTDEAARTAIENIRDELLEILYRRDVEPMETDGEERFDRTRMKAIQRIETEAAEEDNQIVRVSRCGFLWNENVLRPHEVVIKRYKSNEQKGDEA